jgi:hypothetical protein
VKAMMTCGIPNSRISFLTSRLRGLIPSTTRVRDGNVEYPCRQVRFCLQTDIAPDDSGQFQFPHEGECGAPVDLGQYKFTNDPNGNSVLEVQKSERAPVVIENPFNWNPPTAVGTQPVIMPLKPGTLVASERIGTTNQRKAEASLELDLSKPRKTKRR